MLILIYFTVDNVEVVLGTLKMRDWNLRDLNFRHQRGQKCKGGKCETGKCSTRNAGVENAKLENGAQETQGWKMREKQTRDLCVWLMSDLE